MKYGRSDLLTETPDPHRKPKALETLAELRFPQGELKVLSRVCASLCCLYRREGQSEKAQEMARKGFEIATYANNCPSPDVKEAGVCRQTRAECVVSGKAETTTESKRRERRLGWPWQAPPWSLLKKLSKRKTSELYSG